HRSHAEVVSNLPRIDLLALELKDRAARHHFELRQLGQAVDDAFRNTVREVIGVWIAVLIVKRQHRNRYFLKTAGQHPVEGDKPTNKKQAYRKRSRYDNDINPRLLSRSFRRLEISNFCSLQPFRS